MNIQLQNVRVPRYKNRGTTILKKEFILRKIKTEAQDEVAYRPKKQIQVKHI